MLLPEALRGRVPDAWRAQAVARCVALYEAAEAHINLTHDYLNPRALEAVSCLGLHRLTGERRYLDRTVECLDQLITRQYPCGAQPYHTGNWVWGRKPAQVYQYLTAGLMLYLGEALQRADAVDYVRRLMDHACVTTNRRGEAFCTTFEGLHKSATLSAAGRQWPIAARLALAHGDERFAGLARTTYERWADHALTFSYASEEARTALSGHDYTMWDTDDVGNQDKEAHLHTRRLRVNLTYTPETHVSGAPGARIAQGGDRLQGGELVLELETAQNTQRRPVPSRLLFLLLARPASEAPRLQVGIERRDGPALDVCLPPAEASDPVWLEAPLGVVRYAAPDGSAIEIVPELTTADAITVERPPARTVVDRPTRAVAVKPANEGSIRLAFDGPNALDRARYRIRFLPTSP